MYQIVNFAIQLEPNSGQIVDSATAVSLHCNLTMRDDSFTINVVYYSVIRDSAVIN